MVRLYHIFHRIVDGFEYGWIKNPTVKIEGIFESSILVNHRPVFFLSTGRCGTLLFTKLLSQASGVKVFHEPNPTLSLQSKTAWELLSNDSLADVPLLVDLFKTSRESHLFKTARYGKRYIETNRNISFFAPIIKSIIPNALFVHVHRHPADFIRSGIRRGWYSGDHAHDAGRITPIPGSKHAAQWTNYSDVQKIAWLWRSTNSFIDNFAEGLDRDQFHRFNFDELGVNNVNQMLEFLNLSIPQKRIKKIIEKPVNVQRDGNYPKYQDWTNEDKTALKEVCGDLAAKYGYVI